jgi:hypothetical protein
MIGKGTITKWIKEELNETINALDLQIGKPNKNMLLSIFKETNGVLSYLPIDFWTNDEVLLSIPFIHFTEINRRLYELTKIEEFGINAPNYKCANFSSLGKTNITSRAKLDLYLWPIKKNLASYFSEVESKSNFTALIDQWFNLNDRNEKSKFFPMGFNDLFIYFISRITNDERSEKILNEALKYYLESIEDGHDFFEEHLQEIRKLKITLNSLDEPIFPELSKNLIVKSDIENNLQTAKSELFIKEFYFTEAFIVTDQIGSTTVEFTKFGLFAISNKKYAFFDIGDNKEAIKKKAKNDIKAFELSNFEKSGNFCIGEFEEHEGQLIFYQYFFNMHPRIFHKHSNGDLENEGKIFKKITFV